MMTENLKPPESNREVASGWNYVDQLLHACGSPASLGTFKNYVSLLLDYRSRMNLTGIDNVADAVSLHLLDSLELLRHCRLHDGARGIDVGSGAGLPGIALAVAVPGIRMTLLDSRRKRLDFLRLAAGTLDLANVEVAAGRAETVGRNPAYRDTFDFSVARALAVPPVAFEYCLPLVRCGGRAFLWVGPSFEPDEVSLAIPELGGRLSGVHEYTLGPDRKRAIVEVTKEQETPGRYPRRPGIPRKRPLE